MYYFKEESRSAQYLGVRIYNASEYDVECIALYTRWCLAGSTLISPLVLITLLKLELIYTVMCKYTSLTMVSAICFLA